MTPIGLLQRLPLSRHLDTRQLAINKAWITSKASVASVLSVPDVDVVHVTSPSRGEKSARMPLVGRVSFPCASGVTPTWLLELQLSLS